jgi:predicted nucleotidyltransferase
VKPIAEKYHFPAVYLFGSYARGEADKDSDVDIIVDTTGAAARSAFQMGGVFNDLEKEFGQNNVDLLTLATVLSQNRVDSLLPSMRESVMKEMVIIYGE